MGGIARLTPFRVLDTTERRLRRLLEEIGVVSALLPAADVYETTNEFVVELDAPGFEAKELSIEISDHTLKVTGERSQTREVGKSFRLRGRLEDEFERRFELPFDSDREHVKAVLEKGVLQVRVPRRQEVKSQKVEISNPAPPQGKA